MRRRVSKAWLWLLVVALVSGALSVVAFLTLAPGVTPANALADLAWSVRFKVFPVEDPTGLARLHAAVPPGPREQCIACHGDKTHGKLPVHRIHLQSALLPSLACGDCHPRVDLTPRDTTMSATWVDVGFCKKCHSAFPRHRADDRGRSVGLKSDCVGCHAGDEAPEHAKRYLPREAPPSACKGCHGGRVLSWTPRHERADWLAIHGPEALNTGTRGCFDCHDFGLKFCDACHAKKPASHLPAEHWRAVHSTAARADTRVCYTCHRTSFCKKCHVNHEIGWVKSHPVYVHEHGDASCSECHSRSACGFCHAARADGSTSPSASP